jgi:putative DNA primase/helicase
VSGDVRQALVERGIELRRYQPGNHRAPCPWCAKGKRDDALAVKIDADGATWFCHRCGEKGGNRNGDCTSSRRRELSHKQDGKEPSDDGRFERHETLSPWGQTLWENARPIEPGTIAATYLEGRGSALPPFPAETHLRWHPALSDLVSGYTGPALVALVTDTDTGAPLNLHRTWLQPDGSVKAPIDKPRRLLKGHRSRGVVRIWPDTEVTLGLGDRRGAGNLPCGRPRRPDAMLVNHLGRQPRNLPGAAVSRRAHHPGRSRQAESEDRQARRA